MPVHCTAHSSVRYASMLCQYTALLGAPFLDVPPPPGTSTAIQYRTSHSTIAYRSTAPYHTLASYARVIPGHDCTAACARPVPDIAEQHTLG
eukprot:782940-Rhodomonas_salina.1